MAVAVSVAAWGTQEELRRKARIRPTAILVANSLAPSSVRVPAQRLGRFQCVSRDLQDANIFQRTLSADVPRLARTL